MPADTPTETIISLKQQGLTNNQIIAALQRQGYSTPQILDGMNQADLQLQTKRPLGGAKVADANAPNYAEELPAESVDGTRVEEMVEAVIEEKWTELMDNINRIIEWKDRTETRITQMETVMKSIKDDFDKMHSAVLERVGEYDRHITDVGTEVKALEKVFQKVLPGFIENVAELSRVTEELKKNR